MKLRTTLAEFYARYDVIFELAAGIAAALMAYAEMLPFWLIIVLIVVRQLAAMKGMRTEQKKHDA